MIEGPLVKSHSMGEIENLLGTDWNTHWMPDDLDIRLAILMSSDVTTSTSGQSVSE